MQQWASRPRQSLGFLARTPVLEYAWYRPRLLRHAFLEVLPNGLSAPVIGVHLSAVHAAWTERRRVVELRALLRAIKAHEHGFHLLAGDFNTLAPGEVLDAALLPARLRMLVWLGGGRIRWRTIKRILDAGYVDAFRHLNPDVPGFTFPVWNPHLRLDYAFAPSGFANRFRQCVVITSDDAKQASDHFPLSIEI